MKKQHNRILQYMRTHGSITSTEAQIHLSIARLAARISEMRKEGIAIEKKTEYSKNQFGEPVHYARYTLKEGEHEQARETAESRTVCTAAR